MVVVSSWGRGVIDVSCVVIGGENKEYIFDLNVFDFYEF